MKKLDIDKSIRTIWNLNGPHKSLCYSCRRVFSLSLPTVSGGSWHFKIVNNHNAPHIVPELIHSRQQNVDIFMLRKYRSASQIESADHQNSFSNCYHNIFSILLDIFIPFISHSLYTGCIFQLEGEILSHQFIEGRDFFLNIVSKG